MDKQTARDIWHAPRSFPLWRFGPITVALFLLSDALAVLSALVRSDAVLWAATRVMRVANRRSRAWIAANPDRLDKPIRANLRAWWAFVALWALLAVAGWIIGAAR